MGVIETKTFMDGDDVALPLPDELGIGPDETMLIEITGGVITVRRREEREFEVRDV
jgi:urease accessory protein UreE